MRHINPGNLEILINHLKCAAFELPIRDDEKFGTHATPELCRFLADLKFLNHSGEPSNGVWHWNVGYLSGRCSQPARSVERQFPGGGHHGRPSRDRGSIVHSVTLTTLHEKAIYLHEARRVSELERFDYEGRKAYVRSVDSDYFTQAIDYTQVKEPGVSSNRRRSRPLSAPLMAMSG